MASLISKTAATRGSFLRRASTVPHRHVKNFRVSPFSSLSMDSNAVISNNVHQGQQSTNVRREDDVSRVRTIRFYRMLLRQCQALASNTVNKSEITSSKQDTSGCFMLQPRVASSSANMYFRTSPPVATQPFDLLRLFYILVERDNIVKNSNGLPIMLPQSHPQAIKRSYSSAAFAAPTTGPPDMSIDDWFFEVTGGKMPIFRNQNVDDEMRNLLVNTCWTSPDQLQSVVRDAFKTDYRRIDTPGLHKWTIRAIQILREQQDLWKGSSVAVTDRIRTIGTCQSGKTLPGLVRFPDQASKRFTYKIRIENLTPDYVQLMGRSLTIQAIGEDGKAYEEPIVDAKMLDRPYMPSTVLRPGQVFEFVGNVDLKTEKGIVKGCFHMNKVLPNSAVAGMEPLPLGDNIYVDVAPLELSM